MSWTQPLCEDCWDERHPDRAPARDVNGPAETCCLCGHATTSGIFIRIDPASVPFPQEQEPAREAGVEPATDEQIAELVEHVRGQDRYENSVTNGTFLTVAARVWQEQARADSEERARHQIEDERDALARRIDHVRVYCEQVDDAADSTMEREGNAKIPLTALREHMRRIQVRLDGEDAR